MIISGISYRLPVITGRSQWYYQIIRSGPIETDKIDSNIAFGFRRWIVLPLSVTMFEAVFIFHTIQIWNSFLFLLIIMTGVGHQTVPATHILGGLGRSFAGINYSFRMAYTFLTALPMVIVFTITDDKFVRGITGRSTV